MQSPHIKTPLPGPKAQALLKRDALVTSPSYPRDYPFAMSHGKGTEVWDVDGNRFLDFAAGIAVCSTGHSHPAVVKAIKDGKLNTPTPDCFLDGITRRTVIALAKQRGLEVIERTIMPDELGTFSECFIVGTAAEVTPVSEIAEHRYTPGKISETLIHDYSAAVQPKKVAAE